MMGDKEEEKFSMNIGCLFGTFVMFVSIILFFYHIAPKYDNPTPSANNSSANISGDSITVNEDSLNGLYQAAIKNFIVKKDEFSSRVWYYHKAWGKNWVHRCTLTADVDNEGNIWLNSNYFRSSWTFHKYVIVKVGDLVFQTPSLESYESNCKTMVVDGGVYEVNSYSGKEGKIILGCIAASQDKTVKVRFEGNQYYYDVTMNTADKKAIKDCVRLCDLLLLMKQNNISVN